MRNIFFIFYSFYCIILFYIYIDAYIATTTNTNYYTNYYNNFMRHFILLFLMILCEISEMSQALGQIAGQNLPTNQLNGEIITEIKNPEESYTIGKNLAYILDKTHQLTPDQIHEGNLPLQSKFELFKEECVSMGLTDATLWLRLKIKNNSNMQNWLLYCANGFVDKIDLYHKNSKGKWIIQENGINSDPTKRTLNHRFPTFVFNDRDTITRTYYLKIRTKSAMQVPIYLERGFNFSQKSHILELLYGIFAGIMLLMMFSSLFSAISFKDKEYFYYFVFVFGSSVFYLSVSGYLPLYVWKENYMAGKLFLGLGMGCWSAGAALFTRSFLYTTRYFPLMSKLLGFYAIYGVFIGFAAFFMDYIDYVYLVVIGGNIGNLVILIACWVCWLRGNTYARYIAIAWLFYIIGTTLLALSVVGIIPRTLITAHLGEISSVLEILLFSMALSDKYRIIQQNNIKQKIVAQEKIIKLQQENNENLEHKVQERTQELQAKQTEIEVQNEELRQQQEELEASANQLSEQNKLIEEKNAELNITSASLEKKINERTLQLSEANQTLVSQNNQLEQFGFITAHNLRSPVAHLIGLTSIFNLKNINDPTNAEIIPRLRAASIRLDEVIRDLNIILEIRKGINQNMELIDLHVVFKNVSGVLENDIIHSDAIITTNFAQAHKVLFVDVYMKSILYNFISNGIKYAHPDRKPEIIIKTRKEGSFVVLSIADNGLGIDLDKHQSKIFGLYQRFHLHKEGKGIGLYLCKTQLEALGGRITVESVPNQGTTFHLYFKN